MTASRPRSARPHPLLMASLLCPGLLAAADQVKISDVRLTFGLLPSTGSVQESFSDGTGGASTTGQDLNQQSYRGGISLVESIGDLGPAGGLVIGLGYAHSEQYNPASVRNVTIGSNTYVLDGHVQETVNVFDVSVGYAYAFSSHIHFEAAPFLGFGEVGWHDTLQVTNPGPPASTSNEDSNQTRTGYYFEYGVKAGLYYTFDTGIQLGIDVGAMHGQSHGGTASFAVTSTNPAITSLNESDSVKQTGLVTDLTIGYRF